MDFDLQTLRAGLLDLAILIVSLTFHEWGHAATADNLGDDTPRRQGRVTLNPLRHIDPIGTVLFPPISIFSGFSLIGWAKPVMIDPRNLRVSDRAWVTLAGPGMNLMLALLGSIALAFASHLDATMIGFIQQLITINVALMVFNMMPIPPLDGSKFLMYWFGMSEELYVQLSRFSWVLMMVLFNMSATRQLFGKLIALAMTPFNAITDLLS